jgi:hypothetical protein
MPLDSTSKFFFIHVMKTGGTSIADIISANFRANERYPDVCIPPSPDIFARIEAYSFVPGIVANVNALKGQLRMVRGHVPYAVRSLLHDSYIAMTLLRDPVERTVSYLTHCRRYHIEHQKLTLEQIYEDPWFHASFIQNYQTKIFSMSAEESISEERFLPSAVKVPPREELGNGQNLSDDIKLLQRAAPGRFSLECFSASTGVIDVNAQRLEEAKRNLSAVEIVGVTEHYDRFLGKLVEQYGWQIKSIPHRHAGEREAVSPEFHRRIAKDNAFDIELYEFARAIAI